MNARDYQALAARTLIDGPDVPLTPEETMIVWNAIGVAGEAGEIADLIKKGIFHRHGLDVAKVGEEIGDLCWYLAALCTKLGLDLGVLMQANIDKLRRRYPDGWSSTASQARVDLPKPSDWVNCQIGDMSVCTACYRTIVYDGHAWDHLGDVKPRHIAMPALVDGAVMRPPDAVRRASVYTPMPGDMNVCLHCNEQIRFNQFARWEHVPNSANYADPGHTAEPIPF